MLNQIETNCEPETAGFWMQWKESATPCYFPSLTERSVVQSGHLERKFDLGMRKYHQNTTREEAHLDILTAWSILLQLYTGNASISFGLTGQLGRSRLCSTIVDRDTTVRAIRNILGEGLARSENYQEVGFYNSPLFHGLDTRPFCNTAVILNATIPSGSDTTPLRLHIPDTEHAAEARLIYSNAFLEEDDAADVVNTFQQVLGEVIKNPTAVYSGIQVLHPDSSRKLFQWNDVAPTSVDRCVGELFEEQAGRTPANIAIQANDARFTYEELESTSRKLALALQTRSVGPEDVVLLCFPKSAWAVVAMIAVVRAGATMLFFDVTHPMARLQEIQSEVQAKIMLTAPQYADMWDWTGAEVLAVHSDSVDCLPLESQLILDVRPSNSLYLIYTSG
jgi:hypothetical protein